MAPSLSGPGTRSIVSSLGAGGRPKPRSPSRRPVQPSIRSRRPTTRTRTSEGVMTALGGISGRTRNGSRNRAGVGNAGAPAASNRSSGVCPASECVRRWYTTSKQAEHSPFSCASSTSSSISRIDPVRFENLSILPFVVAARGIARISFPRAPRTRGGAARTRTHCRDQPGSPRAPLGKGQSRSPAAVAAYANNSSYLLMTWIGLGVRHDGADEDGLAARRRSRCAGESGRMIGLRCWVHLGQWSSCLSASVSLRNSEAC